MGALGHGWTNICQLVQPDRTTLCATRRPTLLAEGQSARATLAMPLAWDPLRQDFGAEAICLVCEREKTLALNCPINKKFRSSPKTGGLFSFFIPAASTISE